MNKNSGKEATFAKSLNHLLVQLDNVHGCSFVSGPDGTNRESVAAIQSSIFTVCLDGVMPRVPEDTSRSSAAIQMLHGGGSQHFSANRWFDKTLQVAKHTQFFHECLLNIKFGNIYQLHVGVEKVLYYLSSMLYYLCSSLLLERMGRAVLFTSMLQLRAHPSSPWSTTWWNTRKLQ